MELHCNGANLKTHFSQDAETLIIFILYMLRESLYVEGICDHMN